MTQVFASTGIPIARPTRRYNKSEAVCMEPQCEWVALEGNTVLIQSSAMQHCIETGHGVTFIDTRGIEWERFNG